MSMDTGAAEPGSVEAPTPEPKAPAFPDFSTMTEEEQIAYAMQISMQGSRKFIP